MVAVYNSFSQKNVDLPFGLFGLLSGFHLKVVLSNAEIIRWKCNFATEKKKNKTKSLNDPRTVWNSKTP